MSRDPPHLQFCLRGSLSGSPVVLWFRPSRMKTKAAAKFFSLPLRINLPVDVYGVGDGVAEGSTVGLGVAELDGVGVGETSVPGVELGSAE
jgi:hypothetical protein